MFEDNEIDKKKFQDIIKEIIRLEKDNIKNRENTGKMVDEIITIMKNKFDRNF